MLRGDRSVTILAKMRMVIALLFVAACAPSAEAARAPRNDSANTPNASAGTGPIPSTAFAEPSSPPSHRFDTVHIGDRGDGAPPRYTGKRIDLDLKNTDLHEVFRLLADVGRVNIVVGSEVKGAITMKLKGVPWDQALDVIVRSRGLDLSREGNVILVGVSSPVR